MAEIDERILHRRLSEAIIEDGGHVFLCLADFLPADLYRACMDHWPAEKHFVGNGTRKRLINGDLGTATISETQRTFWTGFAATINGKVKPIVADIFLPFLDRKSPVARRDTIAFFDHHNEGMNLDRNYAITPHVDQKYILVSCLLYMPRDRLQKNLGTALYRAKYPAFRTVDVEYPPADHFALHKQFPFLLNTLVAFLQTPTSFHGKPQIRHFRPRRSYQFNLVMRPEWVLETYGDPTPY